MRESKSSSSQTRKQKPARTPEEREQQIVSMAYDYAEKQFREGKASSQVTTYFLKLGSEKERMEREKLETENKLLLAKIEALEVAKNTEALYGEAIKAMKHYGGHDSPVTEVLEDE